MKNGLVLALAILGGLYFLSYFGFRSWALCPGWGWRSSYFNNFGIWPGHPLFWVMVLVVLVCAVVMFFFRSKEPLTSSEKKDRNTCPSCGRSLGQPGAGSQ
ncbi:MAG: hypothetical protein V2B13_13370 [Pseudomonadota bacterium]